MERPQQTLLDLDLINANQELIGIQDNVEYIEYVDMYIYNQYIYCTMQFILGYLL